MALQKGDKVVVIGEKTYDHGFTPGQVVTYTGQEFPKHHRGQWYQFQSEVSDLSQYMLEEHFEAYLEPVKVAAKVEVACSIPVVAEVLPTKAAYAVFNAHDEIVATTSDRDYARELKAALGGKRQGVRIFSYTAEKEIR